MKRDLQRLQETSFDLAVIGAGIHGATIGSLAAACGLSVALLDQGDFCGKTSANSLKIIHGGLRYLQHLDIPRIRDSITSRRWMLANFPDLVKPLRCVMPTSGFGVRSRAAMAAGLAVNDLISWRRNKGMDPANHIGRGRILSKKEFADIVSGIDPDGYSGGALWNDALALNTERIALELIHKLVEDGGVAANYVRVLNVARKDEAKAGLSCRDMETGSEWTLHAEYVVNTAGPLFTSLPGLEPETTPLDKGWSRAINLIVKPVLYPGHAVGLEGKSSFVDKDAVIQKGKRLFFFVPWCERTMIGTVYSQYTDPRIPPVVSKEELHSILAEVNQICPGEGLTPEEICNYHVGLVPSDSSAQTGPFDVCLDKREVIVRHADTGGLKRAFSVKTVKYTTAYTVARDILQCIAAEGRLTLSGWEEKIAAVMLRSGSEQPSQPVGAHLRQRYGRQSSAVVSYLAQESHDSDSRCTSGLVPGEVRYAIEQEMALHLDDVLFRRTGIAAVERPAQELLEATAQQMAKILGWESARLKQEVAAVMAHFQPLEG